MRGQTLRCRLHGTTLVCPSCLASRSKARVTPAQANASRANGKKGGRPKKDAGSEKDAGSSVPQECPVCGSVNIRKDRGRWWCERCQELAL